MKNYLTKWYDDLQCYEQFTTIVITRVMAEFNFLEEAIIEQLSEYINKYVSSGEEDDTYMVEVEKNGISYIADTSFTYEVKGYYDTDYYGGTGYFERTGVNFVFHDIEIYAYDENNEEITEDLPTINEKKVVDEIISQIA